MRQVQQTAAHRNQQRVARRCIVEVGAGAIATTLLVSSEKRGRQDRSPSGAASPEPGTLEEFRDTYQRLLSRIEKSHPAATGIDMFLAAPAPVAIVCGRDIPRDVLPDVVVHGLIDGEYIAASILKTRTALSVGALRRPMVVAAPRASRAIHN